MKFLIVAASPWSGLADTAALLGQAGLKSVQPAPVGNGTFQSAADWHTQLLETLDLQSEGLNASGPLPLGKLWEEMAVGLLRANLGPADWFMADTRATWTLDFWASVDPQARFLLLYLPAEAALYNARQQVLADSAHAAEAWDPTSSAQAWLRHNRQLLRLAQAQPARTLLVNTQQAQLHPQRLVNTLATTLGVRANAAQPVADWDSPIYPPAPIEALVSPALAVELRAMNRQLREAQNPLLSGGTQLVVSSTGEQGVHKTPTLLGWLGKGKQTEQALISAHTELAHTKADLGHARDLVNALAEKKERLQTRLACTEQALLSAQAALKNAQDSTLRKVEELNHIRSSLTLAQVQLQQQRAELERQKAEQQGNADALARRASSLEADLKAAVQQTEHTAQQAEVLQQVHAREKAEFQLESKLFLQQLHQVQQDLENIFHERDALKQQIAASERDKSQAEKARADADMARAGADKKAAALSQQAQVAKAAQDRAEHALTAAEQGKTLANEAKAEAEKAKIESDKKAADLVKQLLEARIAKEQAEKTTTAVEQVKVQAETAKVEADKKVADLGKQLRDAVAAIEQADKAKGAAEQAKLRLENAKADLEKLAKNLAKRLQGTLADKEQVEKAKLALDQKNAELAQQLANVQDQRSKELQDHQQENKQVLQQLHRLQEELEQQYLDRENQARGLEISSERFKRLLVRLPSWADAEEIGATVVVNEPDHKCLKIFAKRLWVGQDSAIDEVQFLFGVKERLAYLEFRPGANGVPKALLSWPQQFADENGQRLLLEPEAPGELGRVQQEIIAGLSSKQWRFIRSLLTLVGSQVGRLGFEDPGQRVYWAHRARELGQALENVSPGLHFEAANVLAVLNSREGSEVLRLAMKGFETKTVRMPLLVFELGIEVKSVRNKLVPQAIHLEFRKWNSSSIPFNGWTPNGKDEAGDYQRITYGLKINAQQSQDLVDLLPEDLELLKLLLAILPKVIAHIDRARYPLVIPEATWIQGLASAYEKHLSEMYARHSALWTGK